MTTPAAGRTVAIVGASNDRRKFGNRAVRAYLRQGYDVRPVHPTLAEVEGLRVYPTLDAIADRVHIVSFYVPPAIGIDLLDAVAAKAPNEFWINPGAGSPPLLARAAALGLKPIQACSIIAIGEVPV